MLHKTFLVAVFAVTMNFFSSPLCAITWSTFDYPDAGSTIIRGIDGDGLIVNYVDLSHHSHNFFYNSSTWTEIFIGTNYANIFGIQGKKLVGATNYGIIYDLDTQMWATLNFSGALGTTIYDIDRDNFVGSYYSPTLRDEHGFLYNGSNWETLDFPEADNTRIQGIDGNYLVGSYGQGFGWRGFVYDGTTWNTLHFPGSGYTEIYDIDERNIVGYSDGHGVIYNLDSQIWTVIDFPGASWTHIYGINYNKIVGQYSASGVNHGFIAIIPEPASALLIIIGAGLLRRRR